MKHIILIIILLLGIITLSPKKSVGVVGVVGIDPYMAGNKQKYLFYNPNAKGISPSPNFRIPNYEDVG